MALGVTPGRYIIMRRTSHLTSGQFLLVAVSVSEYLSESNNHSALSHGEKSEPIQLLNLELDVVPAVNVPFTSMATSTRWGTMLAPGITQQPEDRNLNLLSEASNQSLREGQPAHAS